MQVGDIIKFGHCWMLDDTFDGFLYGPQRMYDINRNLIKRQKIRSKREAKLLTRNGEQHARNNEGKDTRIGDAEGIVVKEERNCFILLSKTTLLPLNQGMGPADYQPFGESYLFKTDLNIRFYNGVFDDNEKKQISDIKVTTGDSDDFFCNAKAMIPNESLIDEVFDNDELCRKLSEPIINELNNELNLNLTYEEYLKKFENAKDIIKVCGSTPYVLMNTIIDDKKIQEDSVHTTNYQIIENKNSKSEENSSIISSISESTIPGFFFGDNGQDQCMVDEKGQYIKRDQNNKYMFEYEAQTKYNGKYEHLYHYAYRPIVYLKK